MRRSILLVGTGGYAENYVRALLDCGSEKKGLFEVAGAVDPFAGQGALYGALRDASVPFHKTIGDFAAAGGRADLAIVSSPIPLHAEQAVGAMERGMAVLLEKPMAGSVADCRRILAARDRAGAFLAVGFQWCYDAPMLAAKRDFEAGRFGRPLRCRALVLWPRAANYYERGSRWAGRKRDAAGRAIFDSVAANAAAHYLFNMLWFCGPGFAASAVRGVQAATYRANAIETYDTITLKGVADSGCEIFFAASHAVEPSRVQNPVFEYEFEKGVLRFNAVGQDNHRLVFEPRAGAPVFYGESNRPDAQMGKIWSALASLDGGDPPLCPGEAAMKHVALVEDAFAAAGEATPFGEGEIRVADGVRYVPGLADALLAAYGRRELLDRAPR